MTLEEHFENAKDLLLMLYHINSLYFRLFENYPKSHPLIKLLDKALPTDNKFQKLRSELENEFYRNIQNPTQYPFIYYDMEEILHKVFKDYPPDNTEQRELKRIELLRTITVEDFIKSYQK